MRIVLALTLISWIFFACESSPPPPSQPKERATSNNTKKSPPPNKGIDTLVNGNRYRLEIIEGEQDQLKIEKISQGKSKTISIPAHKDRLFLAAILFEGAQPQFHPLKVFSDQLFAVGTFDQQLQKIWFIRDLPEGLKVEEFDASKDRIENRGRFLIYLPQENIVAIPSIPERKGQQEQTIVRRYRINEDLILSLRPDTVLQPVR